MQYDIFNGDADGICALVQLRLKAPIESTLITGVKRDIELLGKVSAQANDRLTVLDISFDKNRHYVVDYLDKGASIFYVDHHKSGEIPRHPRLHTIIDTGKAVCTSLLVNQYLEGLYPLWAITAAFGDNLEKSAHQLASQLHLNESQLALLKSLGTYLNYNSYGHKVEDLYVAPDRLFKILVGYHSPLDFIEDSQQDTFRILEVGYHQDLAKAMEIKPEYSSNHVAVYLLPEIAWANRVSGVFSNALVNANPAKAYAVLSANSSGGYQVSVRAPLDNPTGADEFCSGFNSGGGRKAAAGINHLPVADLDDFIQKFEVFYKDARRNN